MVHDPVITILVFLLYCHFTRDYINGYSCFVSEHLKWPLLWLGYKNQLNGQDDIGAETFYTLYEYATGPKADQMKIALNASVSIDSQFSGSILRSSTWLKGNLDSNGNSFPTYFKYLYSLAYIGTSYQSNSFGSDETKFKNFLDGAKFLINDPVTVKDISTLSSYSSYFTSETLVQFSNRLIALNESQFLDVYGMDSSQYKVLDNTTLESFLSTGVITDYISLQTTITIATNIGKCQYFLHFTISLLVFRDSLLENYLPVYAWKNSGLTLIWSFLVRYVTS